MKASPISNVKFHIVYTEFEHSMKSTCEDQRVLLRVSQFESSTFAKTSPPQATV